MYIDTMVAEQCTVHTDSVGIRLHDVPRPRSNCSYTTKLMQNVYVQHTCTFCGYVKPKINYLSRQHFPIKSIGSFCFDIKKGELIVRKTSWHLLLKIEQ